MMRLKVRSNIPLIVLGILILAIVAFLAASCVPSEKEATGDSVIDKTELEKQVRIDLTGYYIESGYNKLFKRSPDGKYYLVRDETGELSERYNELTFMAAEPVYAVLRGRPEYHEPEHLASGFAQESMRKPPMDIGSEIYVKEIVEIDYVKRENPIFPFEFRCYGEEPFWALDIIRDDEAIFKDIGRERVYYLAYEARVIEGDVYRFELGESLSGDEGMSVTIECGECVDSMSGEVYEYRVGIEFEGMTYEGCGEAGEGM